jgi:hypothetical protein
MSRTEQKPESPLDAVYTTMGEGARLRGDWLGSAFVPICDHEFGGAARPTSAGIGSLSPGNSGKRSLWNTAQIFAQRSCKERATGEGNSVQDRSETKVELTTP